MITYVNNVYRSVIPTPNIIKKNCLQQYVDCIISKPIPSQRIFLIRGKCFRLSGKLEEARQDLEQALKLNALNPIILSKIHLQLSWLYVEMGTPKWDHLSLAESSLRACEGNSGDKQKLKVFIEGASQNAYEGDLSSAENACKIALTAPPHLLTVDKQAQILLLLGQAYIMAKNRKEAIKAFERRMHCLSPINGI